MTETYRELFSAKEAQYGLPAGYLSRTAQIESTMNPNAKNENSSAGGLFQFIDSTAAEYNLSNRYDPYEATDAAARLARDNMSTLRKVLGREPTGAELYLAHQQGGGGASSLLRDPSRIVGGDEISLNGGKSGMTAGAFAAQWLNKYNGNSNDAAADMPIFDNPYGGEFGNDDKTDIDAGAYLDVSAPTGPNIFQQLEDEKSAPKPFDTWGEEVGANYDRSISSQVARWQTEGQLDPDFKMDENRYMELVKPLPDNYHPMVLGASSEANLIGRLKWIEKDMEAQKRLDVGGLSAVGAGLVAGILDPIPAAIGIATGGLGYAATGGRLARAGRAAMAGAGVNAAIDYASAAITDDPHADPVMAAIVGAGFGTLGGMLAHGGGSQVEADAAFRAASRMAANKYQLPIQPATAGSLKSSTGLTSGAVIGQTDSVGAMRNTTLRDNLLPEERAELGWVDNWDVDYGFGGSARFDVTGQMTTSDDPVVRLLGMNLFEETAGLKGHGVVPDSVNTVQTTLHRKVIGNFVLDYQPAKAEYIKSLGIGRLNLIQRSAAEADFNRQVTAYVRDPNPAPDSNPHVVKAATAQRRLFDNLRTEANDSGLANLEANPHYTPLVARHTAIARMDQEIPAENMQAFFAQAILKHSPTLSADVVKRMSKGYWNMIRKAGYGIEDDLSRNLQIGDKEGFMRAFNEAAGNKGLLSDEQLDAAFDALSGVMDQTKKGAAESHKGVGYFKKRTLMDYNHKAKVLDRNGVARDISVYDLFEDDAEFLSRRYARSMTGRVAFAKMQVVNPTTGELMIQGIRTEGDLNRVKDMVRESYRKRDEGGFSGKGEDLANQLDNIDFAWKRINGIPVWDNTKSYNQWARRLKTMQFIRLMSNMGLNQAQEGWKIMSLTGFRASLSQLPAIKNMVSGINAGRWDKDKLLTELTDMTGIGLDSMWNKFDMRLDEDRIGQLGGSGFSQKVDQALDAGQQLTSHMSLMRNIMDYQQRWAMKAITQQMVHMARKTIKDGAFDFSRMKPRDRARLASMGIGESDAKLLFKNLMDHSEFDGNKIVGMNSNNWDAEAVSKYRTFLTRYTDRLVQHNDYGALSKWMSQPVASMFVQFRSFVMGAWAKSTLWTFNHGGLKDPRMLTLLLGEMAAGTATYMVRQSHLLATEEGREKWEEEMQPANLLKNGWARTATASILPILMDSALLFTPAGPQFGNARSSGSPTDALFGSPAVDQIKSAATFSSGVMQSLWDGEDMSKNDIKAGVRALPLPMNWVPVTAAIGALIKDRE